jgi:hypothetical protein
MSNQAVIQRLTNFRILWPKQVGLAMKKNLELCVTYAKAHHFYIDRTRKLTDSIKALTPHELGTITRGEFTAEEHYARYVEEGTKPHTIRPKRARILAWEDPHTGKSRFATIVHHPGSRKHRFLSRALLANESTIKRNFDNAWLETRRLARIK